MKPDEPTPVDDLPAFRPIGDLLREHASARPLHPAIVQGESCLTWAELDQRMDRIAASLQRDGLVAGDSVVLCGGMTPWLAATFLGALRAGLVVAPLAYSVTATTFAAMVQDANPKRLFVDEIGFALVPEHYLNDCVAIDAGAPCRSLSLGLNPWV